MCIRDSVYKVALAFQVYASKTVSDDMVDLDTLKGIALQLNAAGFWTKVKPAAFMTAVNGTAINQAAFSELNTLFGISQNPVLTQRDRVKQVREETAAADQPAAYSPAT